MIYWPRSPGIDDKSRLEYASCKACCLCRSWICSCFQRQYNWSIRFCKLGEIDTPFCLSSLSVLLRVSNMFWRDATRSWRFCTKETFWRSALGQKQWSSLDRPRKWMSNFTRIVKTLVKFWKFHAQAVILLSLTLIFPGPHTTLSLSLLHITSYICSPWKM